MESAEEGWYCTRAREKEEAVQDGKTTFDPAPLEWGRWEEEEGGRWVEPWM